MTDDLAFVSGKDFMIFVSLGGNYLVKPKCSKCFVCSNHSQCDWEFHFCWIASFRRTSWVISSVRKQSTPLCSSTVINVLSSTVQWNPFWLVRKTECDFPRIQNARSWTKTTPPELERGKQQGLLVESPFCLSGWDVIPTLSICRFTCHLLFLFCAFSIWFTSYLLYLIFLSPFFLPVCLQCFLSGLAIRGESAVQILFAALAKRVNLSQKCAFLSVFTTVRTIMPSLNVFCGRFQAKTCQNLRFVDDFKQKHAKISRQMANVFQLGQFEGWVCSPLRRKHFLCLFVSCSLCFLFLFFGLFVSLVLVYVFCFCFFCLSVSFVVWHVLSCCLLLCCSPLWSQNIMSFPFAPHFFTFKTATISSKSSKWQVLVMTKRTFSNVKTFHLDFDKTDHDLNAQIYPKVGRIWIISTSNSVVE
jgi:hypothetical protein